MTTRLLYWLQLYLDSSRFIEDVLPHEGRHAGGAVDADQAGREVDPGMARSEVDLKKK